MDRLLFKDNPMNISAGEVSTVRQPILLQPLSVLTITSSIALFLLPLFLFLPFLLPFFLLLLLLLLLLPVPLFLH